MKVPRINVGVDQDRVSCITDIVEVDYINKRFRVADDNWCEFVSMESYHPAPTVNNFMRAIGEWDYHYRASEDQRWVDQGKEYEQALIKLFRALPQEDQHNMHKIADIVTLSILPKPDPFGPGITDYL